MATSAMGRAYLAVLPEAERAEMMDLIKPKAGDNWPRIKDSIEEAVEQVAKRGFTVSIGEWQEDINGVGVPFIPDDGSGILAFNCGAPAFRLDRSRLENELGPRLVGMVQSIERILSGADLDFGPRNNDVPAYAGGEQGGESGIEERTGKRPKSAGRAPRQSGR
jgi:DNA-binding IclR family transcriptional regulator